MRGSLVLPSALTGRSAWRRAWALLAVFIMLSSMLAWSAASARSVLAFGTATKLAITSDVDASYTADADITLTVEVQDADGFRVEDSTATIDLTLTNAGSATLSGDSSNAAVGGVASFTVNVRKVGTGYGLSASSAGLTSDSSATFAITPGALASFTVGAITGQTAGVPFDVEATAKDAWTNIKTDYDGVGAAVSGTLGIALGTDNGADDDSAPDYGDFGEWVAGVATASVTAFKAETEQTVTVSDTSPEASGTSDSFAVDHADAASIAYTVDSNDLADPFNFRPITTEVGTPIYSACAPSATAAPCASLSAGIPSTSVRTLVRDAFGNAVSGSTVDVKNDTTLLGSDATDVNGIADFGGSLSIGTVGTATLTARETTGANNPQTSATISIVNDLEACDNQTCDNNASNTQGPLQKAFGKITTSSDFFTTSNNVLLSTQFVPGSQVSGKCGTNQTIGNATDMVVAGPGAATTAPATTMVLVLPKDTLKAFGITSRGTATFNVCLGALDLTDAVAAGWRAKGMGKKAGLVTTDKDLTDGRYWGTPADCGTATLAASDPCIALRTKQAEAARATLGMTPAEFAVLGIKDADLVIIIRKGSPWDGKGGSY